jgi:hypothetical protein
MKCTGRTSFPNFFVIGAPKAGTTALYACLKQHPDIYMSPVKEPHFFTYEGAVPIFAGPAGASLWRVAVRRPRNYMLLFADVQEQTAIGEASASYLGSPHAPKRIKQYVPHAKIIVLLRQPAERAYSNYQYLRSHGVEPVGDFAQVLALENDRQKEGWYPFYFYREGGYYYDKLCRYFEIFPRDQIKVYLYDDWSTEPRALLSDLFRFLGVDESYEPELKRSNVTRVPRSRRFHHVASHPGCLDPVLSSILPHSVCKWVSATLKDLDDKHNLVPPSPIDPLVRRKLTDEYREDILKTQDLIGRDLTHWLTR